MSDLSKLPQPSAPCLPPGVTSEHGKRAFALQFGTATNEAVKTGSVTHPTNDDLTKFPDGLGSYSKALKQTSPGIVDGPTFEAFLEACSIKTGPVKPAHFQNPAIKLGGSMLLNGPRGAFAWQQIGKDSRGYGAPVVPAPPALGSIEYALELVELYWASLLRDVPFEDYPNDPTAKAAAKELSALAAAHPGAYAGPLDGGKVTPRVLFRGGFNDPAKKKFFPGELEGPYLSQFCLIPTSLGRLTVDQKVRTFAPGQDFMTDFDEWYAIQSGAEPTSAAIFDPVPRIMRCGRDCSAYTQVDELYQAYLIAYLVAKTVGVKANKGIPYGNKYTHEKAFGTLGGPDIAATIGAVARAAINAVWYQKWAVHLRHRPEAGGGVVQLWKDNKLTAADKANLTHFDVVLNSEALKHSHARYGTCLLSQAFAEGSPTHPAYPTGHGTVAGACITVLKFFFDCDADFPSYRVVPTSDGLTVVPYTGPDRLTVNGELHKLAHNVSFGHGLHGGIHWRSDTDYSILLGEQVAIDFLMDQMWAYEEDFDITITQIDGETKNSLQESSGPRRNSPRPRRRYLRKPRSRSGCAARNCETGAPRGQSRVTTARRLISPFS